MDPKIAIIQRYLEAARRQDVPAMQAAFADDLVYRVPGNGPLSGETRGRDAALDYYARIMALTEGTYSITGIVDWLASADRVALIVTESASRKGRRLDWTRVIIFRFRDARIAEIALFDDRVGELDALLSE